MSVNEVRTPKAKKLLEIRGTGPPSSRTFCLGNEDHTIGNSLRHILIQNERVGFAGYSVPHPSEPVVQIRVQTIPPRARGISRESPPPPAVEVLQEACTTLHSQCEFVLQKLEALIPHVREDRERLEQKMLEMAQLQAEEADAEMGQEDEDVDMEE